MAATSWHHPSPSSSPQAGTFEPGSIDQGRQYVVNYHTMDTTWPSDGIVNHSITLMDESLGMNIDELDKQKEVMVNKRAVDSQMSQVFSLSQQFGSSDIVLPSQAQVWGFNLCFLLNPKCHSHVHSS